MAYKKNTGTSTRRKSTTTRVAYTAAAAAGGAIAGAALGKLGLLGGLAAIVVGTMQNNPLMTVAGVAAAVAPGALNSAEKSMAGGIKGQLQDARASIKKLAANVLPKTGINIVMPNAFPSLQLGAMDASYYDNGTMQAEREFENVLISGTGDMSGYDDDESVGRLLEASVQNGEITGEFAGVAGFKEVADEASAAW